MQYAIELYFDPKTEEKLWELPRKIAAEHISTKYLEWKTRPHLTLACFNNVNEMQCIEQLKAFAVRHNTMPAHICSVGMFPDTKTIFVSSVMNVRIYQFHQELHESLKNFDTKGWEWYCPDTWAPHCTIALTGDDESEAFDRAASLVLREFRKLAGEFAAIGLVKLTFPVEELFTVNLKKQ